MKKVLKAKEEGSNKPIKHLVKKINSFPRDDRSNY